MTDSPLLLFAGKREGGRARGLVFILLWKEKRKKHIVSGVMQQWEDNRAVSGQLVHTAQENPTMPRVHEQTFTPLYAQGREEIKSLPHEQCLIFNGRHWGEPSQSNKNTNWFRHTVFHDPVGRSSDETFWRLTNRVEKDGVTKAIGPFVSLCTGYQKPSTKYVCKHYVAYKYEKIFSKE